MLPQETTNHKIIRYSLWSAIVVLPILIAALIFIKLHGHKPASLSSKQSNSTYVSQQQPAKAFSQEPELRVKFDMNSSEIAYLKFNVSGVDGKLVKGVTLSLYALNDSGATVDVYLVPKLADITPMTWKTRPDLAGALKIGSLPAGAGLTRRSISLDQPVWTDGPIELALVGTSNREVRFGSFGSANAPKLSFETQDQKVQALPPVITITANPTSVVEGGSTTLSWTSTNAPASCTASGDWTGDKQPYGSEVLANLKDVKTYDFTLSCLNENGGGSASTPITVTTKAAAPADPGVKTTGSTTPPAANPTPPPTTPPPATPPPTTPPPATPPPPPPPPPVGQTVGVPYTCTGPVSNLHIVGSGNSDPALINLKSGCTGSLSFDITVDAGVDGVKVNGAHDLNITSGSIHCINGQAAGAHQDGVQVQGGTNVIFHNLTVNCPDSSGAGAFYIDGKDFGGISNVICDGCDLKHFVIAYIFTTGKAPVVINSGVRNSILHMSPFQGNRCWTNPAGGSGGMINDNNTCVP